MYLITKQYQNVKDLAMFTLKNNMIDVKKSKGRLHFQTPSNKEIRFVKYGLTFKFIKKYTLS